MELWDLAAGTLITRWKAETTQIRIVVFSPNGRQVATGSATGDIKIWDVATHEELAAFRPDGGSVTALAYSPDGRKLAGAVGWGRSKVSLWEVANGHPLPFPAEHDWISGSSSRRMGVYCRRGLGRRCGAVESALGRPRCRTQGPCHGGLARLFFPDGKTLATGGMDGRVKLWNLATFQEILTFSVPSGTVLRSLCISPDGRTLAVGYMGLPGHHVRFYSAPSLAAIAARERNYDRASVP